MSLISVIMPVYNKELYVCRAIDSVLAQKYEHFELIVVNDGSTDASLEKINEYNDSRIRIVNQENRGVSYARNKGVYESSESSDFLLFLDADDEWYPEHLSIIQHLRDKYPSAGLYSTAYNIVENNQEYRAYFSPEISTDDILIDNYFIYTWENYFHPVCSSNVGIPKDIFLEYNGFSIYDKYGEDLDLWGRIAIDYSVAFSKLAGACIHFDSVNRTSEKIFEEFHLSPFVKSAKKALDADLVSPSKVKDLNKYISKLQLSDAFRCIKLKKLKLARQILHEISLFDVGYKKYLYLFLSYVPHDVIPFGITKQIRKRVRKF